jgi:hypothetical protein
MLGLLCRPRALHHDDNHGHHEITPEKLINVKDGTRAQSAKHRATSVAVAARFDDKNRTNDQPQRFIGKTGQLPGFTNETLLFSVPRMEMIALVYYLLGFGGLGFRRGVLGLRCNPIFLFRMGMGFDIFRCGGLFFLAIKLDVSRRVRCGSRIKRKCCREGKQAEGKGGL